MLSSRPDAAYPRAFPLIASMIACRETRAGGLRAVLLATAAMMGTGSVYAQTTAPGQESAVTDNLVVTGTRINRTEFALPVPAQTLDAQQLEISGANELSEALVELPAVSVDISTENSQSSTQSSGLSTVSLRSLGSERTLTLIDGRRTVGNSATGSTISFSTIPTAFIDRVEVITGGASALYGSDAVTGVINVIMRDDFEGLFFESRAGTSQEGGNTEYGITIAAGANFADNRGNVMLSFEYDNEKPIYAHQRDKIMTPFRLAANRNAQPDTLTPARGTAIPGGLFSGNSGTVDAPSYTANYWFYEDRGTGALTPGFVTARDGFYEGGPETVSIPRERFLLAGKLNYELAENVEFFASAQYSSLYTRSQRTSDSANSGALTADFPIYLSDGVMPHPFVPQPIFDDAIALGRDGIFFRRRWEEFGSRFREAENDTLRMWAGFKGDVISNWSYEVNFGYGEFRRSQSRVGDLVIPNYLESINVEYIDASDPSLGLQCVSDFARSAGCVPLNIFGDGSVSPEAVEWLILRDQLRARNRTTTASAWMTGDLIDLWAGPVSVAFGYDFRKEMSRTRWDPVSTSGAGTVTQQVNQDGVQSVHEGFVEVIIPLLTDAPLAKSLAIEGAARISDYSTVGSVLSFKAGGTWQPVDDIRFRGVFARANRAPNNIELFSRGLGSQSGLPDPCANVTATSVGAYDNTCRQDPIVAAVIASEGFFFDPRLQVQQPSFGNEDLIEETANTITAGAVITPGFAPGLQLAADYYSIKIDNAVGTITSNDILQLCYTSGDFFGTASCSIPVRDAVTGQLMEVRRTSLNIDQLRTKGVDATVAYRFTPADTGIPLLESIPGSVSFTGVMTRVLQYETEAPVPGAGTTFVDDPLGLLGMPKFTSRLSMTWRNGPVRASWRTLIVGSMLNDDNGRTRLEACQQFNNCNDKIALFIDRELTHNFRVSVDLPQVLGGDAQVYAGINNITNNQGPVLYDTGNVGNLDGNHHTLYDINGRFFYGGVKLHF